MSRRPTKTKTKSKSLKMTPDLYRLIEQRAERAQLPMAVWMRSILAQAASRIPEQPNGYLRIREPDGATG